MKTDNHNLRAKLDLRRYFVSRYHVGENADPIRVMDCCAGSGVLWEKLRREFAVEEYWALDKRPKPGRIKIDSTRVLAQHGWSQNVIDCDVTSSPWKHWSAMLPNIFRPTTIFLTIGRGGSGPVALGHDELRAMGITMPSLFKLSGAIVHNLAELSVRYSLARANDFGLRIVELVEAVAGESRFIGVRLEPIAAQLP